MNTHNSCLKKSFSFNKLRSNKKPCLYYSLILPLLLQMSGCLKATTHLQQTPPLSAVISPTTTLTLAAKDPNLEKNDHLLLNQIKQSITQYKLPFEQSEIYQNLKPYHKNYILYLRDKNVDKRLEIIDAKQTLPYFIIIRKAYCQLEDLREKNYNEEPLEEQNIKQLFDKTLSPQNKKQLQILTKELIAQGLYRENFPLDKNIRLKPFQIRIMKQNYIKDFSKYDKRDVDFFKILIVYGDRQETITNKSYSYLNQLSSYYISSEKIYFNGRVSREACREIGCTFFLCFLIPLPYIAYEIIAVKHNICSYYKCVCMDYACSDIEGCTTKYYKTMDDCRINEIYENSIGECKQVCNYDIIARFIQLELLAWLISGFYVFYKLHKNYKSSKGYYKKLKKELDKKANTPIPKKLTIPSKKSYTSSKSLCKRLMNYETIVELSDGRKISKVCGCIESPILLNVDKIFYILKGYFNWMFCAKSKKEESSKQEIVELLISNLKEEKLLAQV